MCSKIDKLIVSCLNDSEVVYYVWLLSIYLTRSFQRVCLANRRCSHGVSTSNEDLPGTVYSLDEQCAMHFGAGYTFYDDVSITVDIGQVLVKQ